MRFIKPPPGNSDSSKQVADNSQEKAVAESLEQTANEPLKKDSLTKIADDLFYVSFICTAAENTGTYETECQEWTEKKNKLSDEDQEEIIRIGAEKFQVMVEKSGKYDNQRKEVERVATTGTVQKMLQLMGDCVNGYGNTGSGYRIDSGELIGKTGTAQIASERGGGYLGGKEDIISSFSGIYPKSNPQVIIYASVKRPSGGSQKPVSNAVKEIVSNISKYYGNSDSNNSKTIDIKDYKVESFTNQKVDKVKLTLNSKGIKYQILGNGSKVIKQSPNSGDIITNNDIIYLITNDNSMKVPSVLGLSSKVSKDVLQKLGLRVKLDGVGYVKEQSVAPGTNITNGMEITLKLAPKYQ